MTRKRRQQPKDQRRRESIRKRHKATRRAKRYSRETVAMRRLYDLPDGGGSRMDKPLFPDGYTMYGKPGAGKTWGGLGAPDLYPTSHEVMFPEASSQ